MTMRWWGGALFAVVFALGLVAGVTKMHRIDEKKCTQCGICVDTCPVKAIKIVKKNRTRVHAIDEAKCTQCGACVEACPVQAISLVDGGQDKPAEAEPPKKDGKKER